MDKGLIELLRQSQALLEHGDTEELMNSSVWNTALRDIARLIVELRGNNHADIALQLQSDLDRLESGVEDGVAGEPVFRQSATYRRWSASRRLRSDVEGVVRLAKRSPAFLGEHGPDLSWLVEETEHGGDGADFIPTRAMRSILEALSEAKTTLFQVDIEQESGEPIKSVKSSLLKLDNQSYVHRPHGVRKGYAITDKGRKYLTMSGQADG